MADARTKTPEQTQHTENQPSLIKKSSPIEPYHVPTRDYLRDEWVEHVYPDVYTIISSETMQRCLMPDQALLNELISNTSPPLLDGINTKSPTDTDFCKYLNELSKVVKEEIESSKEEETSPDYTLVFLPRGDETSIGHPTGTRCRPDIAVVRKYSDTSEGPEESGLCWSHIDGTGEKDSGRSEMQSDGQAASYTAFNLQARPDLRTALGIFVEKGGFKLFASNACRVYQTEHIPWTEEHAHLRPLCAWMWRLYLPDTDPSLTINYTKSKNPTFTLSQGEKIYPNLSIIHAGESIGRRTIVMEYKDPSPNKGFVVKEQYIEEGRRFEEEKILKRIHGEGAFPGVVSLAAHVPSSATGIHVTHGKVETLGYIKRNKTRIILNESGSSLLKGTTPKEMLMALFDALEVSRILFKHRGILHRDFSKNNILIREKPAEYTGPLGHVGDMCFSDYILDEGSWGDDITSDASKRRRLVTRLLIIDFDMSEDRAASGGTIMARTVRGSLTEVFSRRLRIVASGHADIYGTKSARGTMHLEESYNLPTMPRMTGKIAGRYQELFSERLGKFSPNKVEVVEIAQPKELGYTEHYLRYEAESLFWNLLYWSMTAQPAAPQANVQSERTAKGFRMKLLPADWGRLISSGDRRDNSFICCRHFCEEYFHPSYASLHGLLDAMRRHLQADPDCSIDPLKQKPEYFHEVFQRLIINFLAEHLTEPFMNLKRSDTRREVERSGMKGRSTTASRPSVKSAGFKRSAQQISTNGESLADDDYMEPIPKRQRTK